MKTKKLFLTSILLAFACTQSAFANSDNALNYSQMVKLIDQGAGNDAKIFKALKGKAVKLTLVAPGPDSLVVKPGDGVLFVCDTRASNFKKGAVATTVTKVETTHEGDISLSLSHCGS